MTDLEMEMFDLDPDIPARAREGDANAQLLLGQAYFRATQVKDNCFIAFAYISRSADQGYMEAQFRLADLFALGQGTKQSCTDAYKWYTRAAIQGYKKALIRIHNLYQEDKRIHCRGRMESEEKEFIYNPFMGGQFRDLSEYRLDQQKNILNGAISYYTEQFKSYQSLADQRDPGVQSNIAFLYQHGYGTRRYTKWAIEYYLMAAEQGHTDAQYNLGQLYQHNSSIKFHYQKALKWYTLAADGGNIAAQNCVAHFHFKGFATEINYAIALFWYTKAANAGHSEAQVTLGKLHRQGRYIEKNIFESVKWYSLAARQKNNIAYNCLNLLYQNGQLNNCDVQELDAISGRTATLQLCSKLRLDMLNMVEESTQQKKLEALAQHALMADGNAMYQIGLKYYYGHGLNKDRDVGFKWIQNAAKSGLEEAQLKIGGMYEEGGETVHQDYHKASIWYKTGARQKNDVSQCNLGLLYNKGLGVRNDPLEASKWFTFSAQQGNSEAKLQLGILRSEGRGLRQDHDEATKWFTESAMQRNPHAFINLGKLYRDGMGVLQSKSKSLEMYKYAEKFGDMHTHQQLGSIYGDKMGGDYDASKANKLFALAAASGSMDAQYQMALKYLSGDNVNQDYLTAFRLLNKIASKGHEDAAALFNVPILYSVDIKNFTNVLEMFIQAREEYLADSIECNIGNIYERGITFSFPNIPQDYEKALQWYSIAAIKDNSTAHCRLGIMYEEGKGTEVDFQTAISHFKQASRKENVEAIYRLACMYRDGRGQCQDPIKAFYYFTVATNMGHELARSVLILFEDASPHVSHPNYFNIYEEKYQIIYQNTISMLETMAILGNLAIQYQLGVFFDYQDDDKSFEWLLMASEGNITDACYRLGILYEEGRGTTQNYSKAILMYQRASSSDHKEALYRLAHLYQYGNGIQRDYIKAYQLYSRAAQNGHRLAYKVLNITQEPSAFSIEEAHDVYFDDSSDEFKNSILMCEFVGESGDVNMQYKLGIYYEDIKTIPDYYMALKWFATAAANSHKDAIYRLGFLYERGSGTEQDYQKAISLYNLAKEQGNSSAIYRLGIIYHYGRGIKANSDNAILNYICAAELGNSESQFTLGALYETGDLVEKDILQAVVWYTKSYTQNNSDAISSLHKLYIDKPYESFFYDHLFQILSKFERTYKSTDQSYKETYGFMYHKLGTLYNEGLGVEPQYESALEIFAIAAYKYHNTDAREIVRLSFREEDLSKKSQYLKMIDTFWTIRDSINPILQCLLGTAHYFGIDIAMSKKKLFNKLSQGLIEYPIGRAKKKCSLGTLIPIDYSKAFEYYTLSASHGNRIAQFRLADLYFQGLGVEKDEQTAIKMYSDVITDSDHFSCYLSEMYQTGKNGLQDFSKAVEYNKQVKGFNYGYALRNCGILYEYGSGVEQSYEKALQCYNEATQYRNKGAFFSLGLMYYHGRGVDRNYEEALSCFTQIAGGIPRASNSYVYVESRKCENEDQLTHEYSMQDETPITGEAHYYLGVMYKNGLGTEVNQQRANTHFQTASDYYHLGDRMVLG